MIRLRYRCSYESVEAAVQQVNDELQDAGFPPITVEGHVLLIPRYPEILSRLADALPQLKQRILTCL